MKKTHYTCGLEASLELIHGKWKFLVLWNLAGGPKRFGELRRLVGGISEKMLIQELKEMVVDGLAIREDYQEVPPKVVYRLTEAGLSLAEACKPLCTLGNEIIKREGLSVGHAVGRGGRTGAGPHRTAVGPSPGPLPEFAPNDVS